MSVVPPILDANQTTFVGTRMELESQPDLSGFPQIRTVDLGSNHLRMLYADLLPPLVQHLSYRNNGLLSDGLPLQFPDTLITLNLELNCLYDTEHLLRWPTNLKELSLDDNKFRHVPENLPEQLDTLCISYNNLSSLEYLPQGLKKLRAYYNTLKSIGRLPPALTYLNLGHNLLTTRALSQARLPGTLTYLNLHRNKLTYLPPLPDSIETLVVSQNLLTELPSKMPKRLKLLAVNDNRIRTIHIQRHPGQEPFNLYCRDNCITHSLNQLEHDQVARLILVDRNWNELHHERAVLAIQRMFRRYKIRKGIRSWARVKKFVDEYMEVAYHPDVFGRWTQIETWDQWKH